MSGLIRLLAVVLSLFGLAAVGYADEADEIAVEFRGGVKDGGVKLTRSDIEKLPHHRLRTTTPWHDGAVEFEGVLMRDLLRAVGAKGERLRVVALNRYATEIPVADFQKFDAVLAYKRDGKYMPVRDKGPFFIVYPYDADPVLKSDKYYIRSAWQVATITVE